MKLLIQSDDYAISRAVSLGIIHGIKNGVVRNTGIFMNMPYTEECFKWIEPYLDKIGFGIDLNLSTGYTVLSHNEVKGLTHEDGRFFSSSENRKMDNEANNFDHVNYEEAYKEFDAQIQKFIKMVGRKPDYIHNHAYSTKTILKVTQDLVEKYQVPYSKDFSYPAMGWYKFGEGLEGQIKDYGLIDYIINDVNGYLNKEIGLLVTHCGYVDSDIVNLSSFNTCRFKDLEALTSDEVKNWIKDNNIELITYKDIKK